MAQADHLRGILQPRKPVAGRRRLPKRCFGSGCARPVATPRAPRLRALFLRGVPPRAPRLRAPPLSADIASGPCCGIARRPRVGSCSAHWPLGAHWKRIHSTPGSKSPPSRQSTALRAVRGRDALGPGRRARSWRDPGPGRAPRTEGILPSIGSLGCAVNRGVGNSFHGRGESSASKNRSCGNRHEVIKLRR